MYDTSDALASLELVGHSHFPEWAFRANLEHYCPIMHLSHANQKVGKWVPEHDPSLCATPYCTSVRRLRHCYQQLVASIDAEVIDWDLIHDQVNSLYTDYCKSILPYAYLLNLRFSLGACFNIFPS